MTDTATAQRPVSQRAEDVFAWGLWLAKRGPHVRDRLLRFYPSNPPARGHLIQGWRPSGSEDPRLFMGWFSKGAIIRRHGRAVWEHIEAQDRQTKPEGIRHVRKRGRRKYASRFSVLAALVERNGPQPRDVRAIVAPLDQGTP